TRLASASRAGRAMPRALRPLVAAVKLASEAIALTRPCIATIRWPGMLSSVVTMLGAIEVAITPGTTPESSRGRLHLLHTCRPSTLRVPNLSTLTRPHVQIGDSVLTESPSHRLVRPRRISPSDVTSDAHSGCDGPQLPPFAGVSGAMIRSWTRDPRGTDPYGCG